MPKIFTIQVVANIMEQTLNASNLYVALVSLRHDLVVVDDGLWTNQSERKRCYATSLTLRDQDFEGTKRFSFTKVTAKDPYAEFAGLTVVIEEIESIEGSNDGSTPRVFVVVVHRSARDEFDRFAWLRSWVVWID